MNLFLPNLTEAQARAYQRGLYMISRPNPDPNDGTRYFNGIYRHEDDGTFAIAFDTAAPLPVDAVADASAFVMDTPEEQAAWDALVATITQPEWQVMAAKIQSATPENPFTVGDFVPASISAQLVTYAVAALAGYLID